MYSHYIIGILGKIEQSIQTKVENQFKRSRIVIHHRKVTKRDSFSCQTKLYSMTLIDWNGYFVGVDEVIITEVVNLQFRLMIQCKIFNHILERIPIESFHPFTRKTHGESPLRYLRQIKIEILVLIPFSILRDHLLEYCSPPTKCPRLFSLSLFHLFEDILICCPR